MIRIRTGKFAGDQMETKMRQRRQSFASRGSRRVLARDEFGGVDSSRLRTICGQSVSAANACSRTVATVIRSRMRTVCERVCGRGLGADMDCSRTWIVCVCIVIWDCSSSRICRVRSRERSMSRGRFRHSPRLIRGHRNLVKTRGRACPVLNLVRNTLPPLLLQLVSPALQLRHDSLDASDLLDCLRFDACGIIVTQARVRQLHRGVGGVVIYARHIRGRCSRCPTVGWRVSESRSCSWGQFSTTREYECVSATQNAQAVPLVSAEWLRR